MSGISDQAATGRHLKLLSNPPYQDAVQIRLVEDGYLAWLPTVELPKLHKADSPYKATVLSRAEIEPRIPQILEFVQRAMHSSLITISGEEPSALTTIVRV